MKHTTTAQVDVTTGEVGAEVGRSRRRRPVRTCDGRVRPVRTYTEAEYAAKVAAQPEPKRMAWGPNGLDYV